MQITIHQPEHLPWLGLLSKVNAADVWVVLDHVSYRKNYFQNRNRVSQKGDEIWLTVPVTAPQGTPIASVRIADSPGWQRKYLGRLNQALKIEAQTDPRFVDMAKAIAASNPGDSLLDLNMTLFDWMRDLFDIQTPLIFSSELGVESSKSDLILEICKRLAANRYIAGPSGREYLVTDDFAASGIEVKYFNFRHPTYVKNPPPFMPGMSAADAIGNVPKDELPRLIADFELTTT